MRHLRLVHLLEPLCHRITPIQFGEHGAEPTSRRRFGFLFVDLENWGRGWRWRRRRRGSASSRWSSGGLGGDGLGNFLGWQPFGIPYHAAGEVVLDVFGEVSEYLIV